MSSSQTITITSSADERGVIYTITLTVEGGELVGITAQDSDGNECDCFFQLICREEGNRHAECCQVQADGSMVCTPGPCHRDEDEDEGGDEGGDH